MRESDTNKDVSLSILIVDDEETITQILSAGFENNGYTTFTSGDIETALSIIKKHPIHFTLLDVRLPGQSGIDLCRSISKVSPNTINIIMTGYPGVKSAVEAMRTNAYDYLIKPFRIETVLSIFDRAIEEIKAHSLNINNEELVQSLRKENEQLRKMIKDVGSVNKQKHAQYDTRKSREHAAEMSYKKLIKNPLIIKKENAND
ncbi:MAG TPA: response regulator [Candidatus Marinimicrobia bacterium]|jgi:DNA-binding NtrC family response regulator|nr:response regulator [Candidatus Neomarinimicrobiota bacterium]|tara:strand:- start:2505 stop:3113 length:609 start_codon:yes stop_codon:yes gene_type:complete